MFENMISAIGVVYVRNDRNVIKPLELDFYFPDLKFAVEINGPTHYRPIYGEEALAASKARDKRKRDLCKKLGIKLRVVKPAKDGVMQRRFATVLREISRCQEVNI
jgi:very-short-patch-repair endonuclease